MEKLQSRREFLKTSGKVLAGVALASSGLPLFNVNAEAAAIESASYPFPYAKIDPQVTMERGYKSYYSLGGCGVGAYDAIVGQLAETVGYPYNQIPIKMLANASTGYGVGSLCGALGGAVAAIGLVCEPADSKKIAGELLGWYREHPFPEYQPEIKNVSSVAGSVNCIDSVGKFMEASGLAMASDERKARCGGVTGEVAAKAVELLNTYFGV